MLMELKLTCFHELDIMLQRPTQFKELLREGDPYQNAKHFFHQTEKKNLE